MQILIITGSASAFWFQEKTLPGERITADRHEVGKRKKIRKQENMKENRSIYYYYPPKVTLSKVAKTRGFH